MRIIKLISIVLFFTIGVNAIPIQIRDFRDMPSEVISNFNKMGTDTTAMLNSFESAYFNAIFIKDSLNGFDFTNKLIGFWNPVYVKGKMEFFESEKQRYEKNTTPSSSILHIFNANEKIESGGYDAAIIYWSKRLYTNEEVIERIKD